MLLNYAEVTKDLEDGFVPIEKPEILLSEEFDIHTKMTLELDGFGFYLSNHPVTEYKLKYPNSISISSIANYFDQEVEMICLVDRMKEITTKKQEKMAFISGSDEVSQIELVLFPSVYKTLSIDQGDVIHIIGKVEKRFDKHQVVVKSIQVLYH